MPSGLLLTAIQGNKSAGEIDAGFVFSVRCNLKNFEQQTLNLKPNRKKCEYEPSRRNISKDVRLG